MRELLNFCKRKRHIFCFGAGAYGRRIHCFLDEHGIFLKGFIVTHKSNEKSVRGVPIYAFEEIADLLNESSVLIGVGKKYRNEIVDFLRMHQVLDFFVLTDEMLEQLKENIHYRNEYSSHYDVCVLLYHRVCHLNIDTWKLAVTPEVFEEHIRFLSNHYDILRLEDSWKSVKRRSVVITFDDGYVDNYLYALPILEKYKVPATIFVCTGNIDSQNEFWWDELERIICCNPRLPREIEYNGRIIRVATLEEKQSACYVLHSILKAMQPDERKNVLNEMSDNWKAGRLSRSENRTMNSEELKILAQSPYITIGGHTVTHSALALESETMQKIEIEKSKADLEKIIGKSITVFSHPFGQKDDFSDVTIKIAKSCSYKKVAAAYRGLTGANENLFCIPRNGIPAGTSQRELERYIKDIWCVYG